MSVMVFGFSSCGDDSEKASGDEKKEKGSADIDEASLDSPCGCAEAFLTLIEEGIEMGTDFKEIDDPSDEAREEFEEDFKPLKAKMDEIEKKCKGDLDPDKADKDCEAIKELEDKVKEFINLML